MVVQDAFLTDTAKLADVVFPVAIHADHYGIKGVSGVNLRKVKLPADKPCDYAFALKITGLTIEHSE